MEIDYSSLSDKELSQMLKDYGVNVGPVNMATRKVYEKKLHKLKTGQAPPSVPKYEPVANDEDEDDDEIQFKPTPVSRQPPPPAPSVVRTPDPPQTRQRRDPADIYSPKIDSRPSLGSARKTTLSYDTRRPDTTQEKTSSPAAQVQSQSGGGLPLWVKVTALLGAVILMYLIYVNMESNTASNIPKIPSKMEV